MSDPSAVFQGCLMCGVDRDALADAARMVLAHRADFGVPKMMQVPALELAALEELVAVVCEQIPGLLEALEELPAPPG